MNIVIANQPVGLPFTPKTFPQGSVFYHCETLMVVVKWVSQTECSVMCLQTGISESFTEDTANLTYYKITKLTASLL